jgi:hypothetical protein
LRQERGTKHGEKPQSEYRPYSLHGKLLLKTAAPSMRAPRGPLVALGKDEPFGVLPRRKRASGSYTAIPSNFTLHPFA